MIANISRFKKSELLEVMGTDYILLAKAKGIGGTYIMPRIRLAEKKYITPFETMRP